MKIISLVWTVVIFGIILTFGYYMFTTIQSVQTENSTEYNMTETGVASFGMFNRFLPAIILIVVIIVIVTILFMIPKNSNKSF